MRDAMDHLIFLMFSMGASVIGWLMAHRPLRTYRLFTAGNDNAPRILVGFCRIIGWCFAIVFAAGSVMYLVLIFHDLLR